MVVETGGASSPPKPCGKPHGKVFFTLGCDNCVQGVACHGCVRPEVMQRGRWVSAPMPQPEPTYPVAGERQHDELPRQRHPVGLLAAALALLITVGGLQVYQSYAVRLAGQYLQAVNLQALPIKWEDLTFQRAAYASGRWLPIYGSSELYCCGDPYRGTQLFARMPTGFDLFAVGRAGTADLFFLETFGALGNDLRGKKLVISDSPPWFFGRDGLAPKPYDGNFSPEIAEMFVYQSPLSLALRQAGARQMLAYPQTLRGQPLLRLGLDTLASGTPRSLIAYAALRPVGWLDAWVKQIQDAYQTVRFIQQHPAFARNAPPQPRPLDWPALARQGTQIAAARAEGEPFGYPISIFNKLRRQKAFRTALQLYCSGATNRDGKVYPYPTGWEQNMQHSAEWTDLQLELEALKQLGAHPFVSSIPMPGLYDDETNLSQPARQGYYTKFAQVTQQAGVPAIAYQAHDEDRYFLNDTGAHFTPRGWIFASRALDLFWHGQSLATIHLALATLNAASPPAGLPNPATSAYCPVGAGG